MIFEFVHVLAAAGYGAHPATFSYFSTMAATCPPPMSPDPASVAHDLLKLEASTPDIPHAVVELEFVTSIVVEFNKLPSYTSHALSVVANTTHAV